MLVFPAVWALLYTAETVLCDVIGLAEFTWTKLIAAAATGGCTRPVIRNNEDRKRTNRKPCTFRDAAVIDPPSKPPAQLGIESSRNEPLPLRKRCGETVCRPEVIAS